MKFSAAFVAVALSLLQISAAMPVEEQVANVADVANENAALPYKEDPYGAQPPPPPSLPPPRPSPPRPVAHCPLDVVKEPPAGNDCLDALSKLAPVWRAGATTGYDHYFTVFEKDYRNLLTRGFKAEGTPFAIFTEKVPGSVPVWIFHHAGRNDHTYTTSEAEMKNVLTPANGWKRDKIAGYVFKTNKCGGQKLFRLHKTVDNWPKIYPGGRAYDNFVNVYDHYLTINAGAIPESVNVHKWKLDGPIGFAWPIGAGQAARLELQRRNAARREALAKARERARAKQAACRKAHAAKVAEWERKYGRRDRD
ncbi:hypothetical protein HGRIS_009422 [Hohenbuehelia grisea]|uniref:DUF5648 domain-containing protein n=1 Tax=Hohenbuehelia grisea TaxID=104357 RepID=A0ABR3J1I8_9AGAR